MTPQLAAAMIDAVRAAVEDDKVTPGVIGFIATAGVAIVVVLLIIDMTRRVRRVNQRAMIREQLEAELAAKESGADGTAAPASDASASDTSSGADAAAPGAATPPSTPQSPTDIDRA